MAGKSQSGKAKAERIAGQGALKLTDNEIREIVRVRKPETGETEEQWTGDYIFENERQSFRTRKKRSLEDGWRVDLYYLWLPSIEMSIERVAERVAHGGHNIPLESIIRRYPRSIANLLEHYAPLCISTICLDNSGSAPEVIFMQDESGRMVKSQKFYTSLLSGAGHDE